MYCVEIISIKEIMAFLLYTCKSSYLGSRGHSRSLKLVPFESFGAVLLFTFYSNCGTILRE